ncbi:MAG: FHA domain-containing protein [Aggregatilineales bacterium]
MATTQQLFETYIHLRAEGKDATAALQQLRSQIEQLRAADRSELVKRVREYEASRSQKPASTNNKPIEAVSPGLSSAATTTMPASSTAAEAKPASAAPAALGPKKMTITCPNCKKQNAPNEVFCYSCGTALQNSTSIFATTCFDDATSSILDSSFFGSDSTLVLVMRDTKQTYRIQPQHQEHEVVIGRSDGGTMKPDIDLADQNAGQLGVSRLHLSLKYNPQQQTLSVTDLNSSNGTFVNGQRLYGQEVRVLRHGDELRLGRLVVRVAFNHPGEVKG